MDEREITVGRDGGEMRTFIAHPETGGPFPVAVLFMDGIGYRDQLKENARRFALAGYYCMVPDLFYRSGIVFDFDPADIWTDPSPDNPARKKLMQAVSSVKPETVTDDTRAAFEAIAADPAAASGPKVCVGYCMGARVALRAASAMPADFVAAAGIHPGALVNDKPDSPHLDLPSVRGELYYSFAEIDQSATPEIDNRFRDEMAAYGVRGTVEQVHGVAHGFSMADLPVYDHDASERHFEMTIDLWNRSLARAVR